MAITNEEIAEKLNEIEKSINQSKPLHEVTLRVIEVAIIPVLGLMLSYVVLTSSNKLVNAQLALAKESENTRNQEAEIATELKIFELFIDDLKSPEPTVRDRAISLIGLLDTQTQIKIRSWLEAGGGDLSQDEKQRAIQEIDSRLLQAVNDYINKYRIQVFYDSSQNGHQSEANDIKNALIDLGVNSDIQVLPQGDRASTDQIRYYEQSERDVAEALQFVLSETYTRRSFNLQTVYTESPGSISIFLKTGS